MTEPTILSVFRMVRDRVSITVWRRESEVKESYDHSDLAQKVNLMHDREVTPAHVARVLARMDRVWCAEVCKYWSGVMGDGVRVYKEDDSQ